MSCFIILHVFPTSYGPFQETKETTEAFQLSGARRPHPGFGTRATAWGIHELRIEKICSLELYPLLLSLRIQSPKLRIVTTIYYSTMMRV